MSEGEIDEAFERVSRCTLRERINSLERQLQSSSEMSELIRDRNRKLRNMVTHWQGKHAIVVRENNQLRRKLERIRTSEENLSAIRERFDNGTELCDCGFPITQDSCPKCGTWHDLYGRR